MASEVVAVVGSIIVVQWAGKILQNVLVFRTEVKFLAFYNKGLNCDPWKLCGYSLGITNLSIVSRCMNRFLTFFFFYTI